MTTNNTTMTITLGTTLNKQGKRVEKTGKFTIPKNVVDNTFFLVSVQTWVNIFVEDKLKHDYDKAQTDFAEDSITQEKLDSITQALDSWTEYIDSFNDSILKEYNVEEQEIEEFLSTINDTIMHDTFAMLYAITLTGAKKLRDTQLRFQACDISQESVADYVKVFSPDYKPTAEYQKKAVESIITFCNSNFGTECTGTEDTLYKRMDYTKKITKGSIEKLLIPRCKKPLKHNNDGKGVEDKFLDSYTIAVQLGFLALHYCGIPLWNGNETKNAEIINAGGIAKVNVPKRRSSK